MDANNPNAQGTEQAAVPPQQTPSVPEGIQKRFDELTANWRQTEAKLQEREQAFQQLQQHNAELVSLVATLAPKATEPQAPAVDIDPDEKRKVEAVLSPQLKAMEQRLAALQAQLAESRFQQVAAQEDPRVVAEAQKLLQVWQRNGYSGWTQEDAIVYARGKLAASDRQTKAQNTSALQSFNQLGQPLVAGSAPPPVMPPAPEELPDPTNVPLSDLNDYLAKLTKRMGG